MKFHEKKNYFRFSQNCYLILRNFADEYRKILQRNRTKFRETCQFGGLDPRHVHIKSDKTEMCKK
jgi:hypothetical protein